MEYIEKTLTSIITHDTNSITFTDDFINDNSIIDVYFSSDDIIPTNQEQIGNRLIISIEPKNYDVSIAVHITNDDTIDYSDELDEINDKIDGLNASNINYDEHSTLFSAMGDIDSLETESKNIVGAINENFIYVSNGKSIIASAITDKGVQTLATDTFQTMATNISNIPSGGGGWRKILSNGQISTLSEYKYPQFTDSIPNTNNYLLYVVLTEQSTFTAPFNVIVYRTTTGNIDCNIGARSLKITFNRNGVYTVTYTGSWANLYIDCYIQKVEV